MKNKDLLRLYHIKEAIHLIFEFVEGVSATDFFADEMRKSAVVRQFEIIGEAANHISEQTYRLDTSIPWLIMRNFRNKLIHEYFRVDMGIIWTTIQYDLKPLQEQIETLIKHLGKQNTV